MHGALIYNQTLYVPYMNIHTQSLYFPRSSKRSLSFNVSVRFRTKERGARVKLCVKNGATKTAGRGGEERKETACPSFPSPLSFFARPKPEIPFLGLSLLRNQETLAAQTDAGYNVSCFLRLLRARIKGEGWGKDKGKTRGEGENKGPVPKERSLGSLLYISGLSLEPTLLTRTLTCLFLSANEVDVFFQR